ncbi:hypothetical protein LWI28_018357 [Acer negundo]|uniref:Uncharacterized protein n=1 Tax=Acer negundo TaxID=4023 RepID=A0AAD5NUZ8_ACENE|nr:hypothetical protein LWI28_018357 [Acer negundo]
MQDRDGGLRTEEERNVKKRRRFYFLCYLSLFHSIKCRVVQFFRARVGIRAGGEDNRQPKTTNLTGFVLQVKCTLGG